MTSKIPSKVEHTLYLILSLVIYVFMQLKMLLRNEGTLKKKTQHFKNSIDKTLADKRWQRSLEYTSMFVIFFRINTVFQNS